MSDVEPPPSQENEPGLAGPDETVEVLGRPPIWSQIPVRLILGAILGAAAAYVCYFEILASQPPMPNSWLGGGAAAGAVIGLLIPRPRWVRGALVEPAKLTVAPSRGGPVEVSSIAMIAGRRGLSFDGGEIMAPKSVSLITPQGRFPILIGPILSTHVLELLQSRFDTAVVLDFDGKVSIPEPPAGTSSSDYHDLVHSMIDDEFKSRLTGVRIAIVVSLVVAAACGAGAAAFIATGSTSGARLAVGTIVGVVAAILAVIEWTRIRSARSRAQSEADRRFA